jgi:predicted RNA-binding protein YlqC (UPF0109 family)
MKQLVEDIARALVDAPDLVNVAVNVKATPSPSEHATTLELKVAPGDLGKVIGKQGRTARSIRTILAVAGAKTNRKFNLEIVE